MRTNAELNATIFDLARRVEELEQRVAGQHHPPLSVVLMIRCYRDAHGAVRALDPSSAAAWVAQFSLWDVRALQELSKAVADPFPFRPFLAVLDACVLQSIPSALAALARFEAVAQDFLRAVGLELVRPRDVMHTMQLREVLERLTAPRT